MDYKHHIHDSYKEIFIQKLNVYHTML